MEMKESLSREVQKEGQSGLQNYNAPFTNLTFDKEILSLPILRRWLKISLKSTGGSHEKCTCSPV